MIFIEEKETSKLPGITSLFVSFNYSAELVDILHQQASAYFNKKTKLWEVSCESLPNLLKAFRKYDDVCVKLKKDRHTVEKTEQLITKPKTISFPHQIEGVQFGLNHNKWLLLDEPGLGKSKTIIDLATELKARDKIKHCLIICGINTLRHNWAKEIETHSNLSWKILGEKVTKNGKVKNGSVKERLQDLKSTIKEFFVITNIETLRNDDIVKEINSGCNSFDMIVVDEIHTAKSPTSQQGKHLLKLKNAPYQIGATGTLLLNSPMDSYVPLKWIGAEKSTFSNYKYYYCNYGGPFGNILVGYRHLDTLKEMLNRYSLRRTKELLDLPPKNIINEYVDMEEKQASFYNNIKQGIIEQVDKVHMSTTNLLAMCARLRQATACPSILTTEQVPSAKIDRAIDLAKQIVYNGDKVVIFSTFKETLNYLADGLAELNPLISTGDVKDSVISENINKFQTDNSYKVFLGTWQKCGTGITLTAAQYMIFIDVPWTDAVYKQAQDRIHRIGTKDSVFIYHLITKDTIDERVLDIVTDKGLISDYVVDDEVNPALIDKLRSIILDLENS